MTVKFDPNNIQKVRWNYSPYAGYWPYPSTENDEDSEWVLFDEYDILRQHYKEAVALLEKSISSGDAKRHLETCAQIRKFLADGVEV